MSTIKKIGKEKKMSAGVLCQQQNCGRFKCIDDRWQLVS